MKHFSKLYLLVQVSPCQQGLRLSCEVVLTSLLQNSVTRRQKQGTISLKL